MKQTAIAMLIVTVLAAVAGALYGLRIATPGMDHPARRRGVEEKPGAAEP